MSEEVSFEKKYPSVVIKVDTIDFEQGPYTKAKRFSINDGEFTGVIHESLHRLIKQGKTCRFWYQIPGISDTYIHVLCVATYPEFVKIGEGK